MLRSKPADALPRILVNEYMLDWLIIGGGVHGTYLANALTDYYKAWKKCTLRVLDSECSLMARWESMTTNVGMTFLRSPRVHHIDIHSNSLHEFAMNNCKDLRRCYAAPYSRPSLTLFRRHSQWVISRNKLAKLIMNGRATHIKELSTGLDISTTFGSIKARRVLLCLGLSDQLHMPGWTKTLRRLKRNVVHIFDRNMSLDKLDLSKTVVVVGGGLTSAQVALACQNRGCSRVTMITRHPLRVSQFDADPGWIGPKNLTEFRKIGDYSIRRKIIDSARNRGSMPKDIAAKLTKHIKKGTINAVFGEIERCIEGENDTLRLWLTGRSEPIDAHTIILSTAFGKQRPGRHLIHQTVDELNLPCAPCGYPITDAALRWHPRIFVSGPLAELEIGPVARNIIGARLVAKRLLADL